MNPLAYLRDKFVVACARRMMARQAGRLPPMAVVTGDYVSLKALLHGRFEDLQLTLLEQQVLPKIAQRALCLDIGANIGNHSVSFSRSFERVIAFEPNVQVFDVLALNAKWCGNIVPVPLGASDRAFRAVAAVPQGNLGAAQIVDGPAREGEQTVEFECVRVDDFLAAEDFAQVGLIKVDVEGHEFAALTGCRRIIEAAKPVIVFELLRQDFDTSGLKVWELLRAHGYTHFYEVDKSVRAIERPRRKNYKMIVAATMPVV
jgi:FkbM family methyltransferase